MLSLPKILLFLAIVVVVVLVSKSLKGRGGKSVEAEDKDPDANPDTNPDNLALDLAECAACGNFVAADTRGCERAECPHAN
ncbi:MAG: hypothetical protein OSB58_07350 [Alphaproteobacteria bacterium]|jgi:hypothetical protein|nr:hypothetical protein [Alphaproteobacteria bacterium]